MQTKKKVQMNCVFGEESTDYHKVYRTLAVLRVRIRGNQNNPGWNGQRQARMGTPYPFVMACAYLYKTTREQLYDKNSGDHVSNRLGRLSSTSLPGCDIQNVIKYHRNGGLPGGMRWSVTASLLKASTSSVHNPNEPNDVLVASQLCVDRRREYSTRIPDVRQYPLS